MDVLRIRRAEPGRGNKNDVGMKMNRFGKAILCLAVLLLVLAGASALAETQLLFSPANPKAGDYVDITVVPDRDDATGVRYELSTPAGVVYKSKSKDLSTHFTASFRPREEAEYTLTAVVVYGKKDTVTVSVTIPVSGTAPVQEGPDVVYSQKDGWWHKVMYRTKKPVESLEKGGCAIFTLSHLLQRRGFTGEEVLPALLASKNSRFYVQGGTDNGGLITQASKDYNFVTEDELIESEHEIAASLRRGDMFSFSIVTGHIAMADGISEDGTKVHIVDSAAGATFERKDRWKTQGHISYQEEDGSFTEAMSADQLPGIRWFFETGEYGGMEYWMDLHYYAHQGMRLVRTPWLRADLGNGLQTVSMEYAGALICKINTGSDSVRVPSRDLAWTTEGADSPQIAVVTNKKGAKLLDGDGNPLSWVKNPVSPGAMFPVITVEDDLCYVYWKGVSCYLSRKNVDLLPVRQDSFSTGIVSMNGKTAGTAKVTVRNTPKNNGVRVTEWTIGTPVAIVETGSEYSLVEGKGYRGWIQNKYLTPDAAE